MTCEPMTSEVRRPTISHLHRSRGGAANASRYAYTVEGALVTSSQIAKRLGICVDAARRRAKRGPFPLTWDSLAITHLDVSE